MKRKQFRNISISNLMQYRLPWAGKVSILHRVSGASLFLALPFLLYLFDLSLTSENSFNHFNDIFSMLPIKLVLLGLIWAYLHHFCAGIRFLMLDMHKGIEKHQIQKSAIAVLIASLSLTAVVAAKLFHLF